MSVDVVDRQISAYNSHDLESFLACYAPDVTVRDSQGATMMSGIDAVRREYREWFAAHPDVHAEVSNRLASGSWVVDEEHVSMAGTVMNALVGYHVVEGAIDAVVLLSEEP